MSSGSPEPTPGEQVDDRSEDVPRPDGDDVVNFFLVNRDYDFEEKVPSGVPEFHDNGQLDRVRAIIDGAEEYDKLPRFWFTGPTGCGKTTAARRIAQEIDAPMFTVQGLHDIRKSDILGEPSVVGGNTYFNDGPVPKALLSSQERKTVLFFDEANRSPPETKGILFPLLDGRVRVHTGRGNEVIKGDPHNLIVIVTTNEGPEYFVEQLDLAERRRYGGKFHITYVGMEDFEAGVDLIRERTPVGDTLARMLVTTANITRDYADNDDRRVKKGIPTSMILEWATTAAIYADAEVTDQPIMTALYDEVLKPFYDGNPDAQKTIETIASSHLYGAPVDEENLVQWVKGSLAQRVDDGGAEEESERMFRNLIAGEKIDVEELTDEEEASAALND